MIEGIHPEVNRRIKGGSFASVYNFNVDPTCCIVSHERVDLETCVVKEGSVEFVAGSAANLEYDVSDREQDCRYVGNGLWLRLESLRQELALTTICVHIGPDNTGMVEIEHATWLESPENVEARILAVLAEHLGYEVSRQDSEMKAVYMAAASSKVARMVDGK